MSMQGVDCVNLGGLTKNIVEEVREYDHFLSDITMSYGKPRNA